MSTNLLRNFLFFFSVLLLVCMGAVAYSSYKAEARSTDAADSYSKRNNHNSEMPWEALTSQLLGAVSL